MKTQETARRVIPLLDLTSLGAGEGAGHIDGLCRAAAAARVAAVCVWPQFVERCRSRLNGTGIAVATVANFPQGGDDVAGVAAEVARAVESGAAEVDLVMPYAAWLRGDTGLARDMIAHAKQSCGSGALLKVILETGRLRTPEHVQGASRDAIAAGADFLKTSTGKTRVSATPTAAALILDVIAATPRPVGFKAAGGIRSVAQAANYLRLADRIMGPGWARPQTFRFGASALLDACLQALPGSRLH